VWRRGVMHTAGAAGEHITDQTYTPR
jgi:hypothetical protein